MDKVIQIIPCDGWYANVSQSPGAKLPDGSENRGSVFKVACWALLDSGRTVAMVAGEEGGELFPVDQYFDNHNIDLYTDAEAFSDYPDVLFTQSVTPEVEPPDDGDFILVGVGSNAPTEESTGVWWAAWRRQP